MVRVFGSVLSPFARKVYLALDYKGVAYESVDVVPHADSPEFRAASPLGLVPALADRDFLISDSSVICDYIEQRYPDRPLYPSDAGYEIDRQRWPRLSAYLQAFKALPFVAMRLEKEAAYLASLGQQAD